MNRISESTTKAANGRRKLLRATMSAPALLTVYSGSAMAGASTRCLANAVAHPTTRPVITAGTPAAAQSTDAFVRVRLYSNGPTNNPTYWVKGSDLGSFVDTTQVPSATQWRKFRIEGSDANSFYPGNGATIDSMPSNAQPSNRYAAVRYDATGNVVGVGASGSGSAITQSCWHSFPSP